MKFSKTLVVLGMVLSCALVQVDSSNIACGADGTITATIQASDVIAMGVPDPVDTLGINTNLPTAAEYALLDGNCTGVFTSGDLVFSFNLDECDPSISEDGDKVVYCWNLWKVPQTDDFTLVARYENDCIKFECRYPKIGEVSLSFDPTLAKNDYSTTALGDFVFTMGLYQNLSPLTAISGDVVVSNVIYGRITLDVANAGTLTAKVKKCWASNTNNPVPETYVFIDSFCGVNSASNDSAGTSEVTTGGTSLDSDFKFTSFIFADEIDTHSTVWIHCQVCACDTSAGGSNTCPLSPAPCANPGKKKREIIHDEEDLAANTRIVSAGPLHIYPAPRNCDKNNGECDEVCTMEGNNAVCSCHGNRVLTGDRKSCIERGFVVADEEPEAHSETEEFLYVNATTVFVAMALLMATLLIAALVFRRCSRSEFQKPRVFQSA